MMQPLRNSVLGIALIFMTFSMGWAAKDELTWMSLLLGNKTIARVPTVTSAGQTWMDRNLGASRVAISFDDSEAYGDLYQWGRLTDGHQVRTSPTTSTLSTSDIPGHDSFIMTDVIPYDWRYSQKDELWQGEVGINNPCPSGFRLPTLTELDAERVSWDSYNSAGAFASPLKLVAAGYRSFGSGALYLTGSHGYYWSSTVKVIFSSGLGFTSSSFYLLNSYYRSSGHSVRCIKD